MTLLEAIKQRHSVRAYLDKEVEKEKIEILKQEIENCNKESGLHFQLVENEPLAFQSITAHYGKFREVKNYIACVGKKAEDLSERVGYYGEKLVLLLQTLNLNTCWVALTFKKVPNAFVVRGDEKLVCLISFGYGVTQGNAHKIKKYEDVCNVSSPTDNFRKGVEAALLAPTAINQQKFFITIENNKPVIKRKGLGIYTKIDLGIVKLHFELGSGEKL